MGRSSGMGLLGSEGGREGEGERFSFSSSNEGKFGKGISTSGTSPFSEGFACSIQSNLKLLFHAVLGVLGVHRGRGCWGIVEKGERTALTFKPFMFATFALNVRIRNPFCIFRWMKIGSD